MKPKKSDKPEPTFESAMAELEQIVAAMEEGAMPLEELLGRYEQGMALVRLCAQRLARAEQQVELLGGELDKALAAKDAPEKGGKLVEKKRVTAEQEVVMEAPVPETEKRNADQEEDSEEFSF